MERFRDLYAKMANQQRPNSSCNDEQTKNQKTFEPKQSQRDLKFIYEPKHCKNSEGRSQDHKNADSLHVNRAEVLKSLDSNYRVTTLTDCEKLSYNTSDGTSLIYTGHDTASARQTAMVLVRKNLHSDYMNSSKEELSQKETERAPSTAQITSSNYPADIEIVSRIHNNTRDNTLCSSQHANHINTSKMSMGQIQKYVPSVDHAALFASVHAEVNESTQSEHEDEEFREVSFNGLKTGYSPRHAPTQALMPVLMQHSQNTLNNRKKQNQSNNFYAPNLDAPGLNSTQTSRKIEDYNKNGVLSIRSQYSSQERALNLDLIEECSPFQERETLKSSRVSQRYAETRSRQSSKIDQQEHLFDTQLFKNKIQTQRGISPYRSIAAQPSSSKTSQKKLSQSRHSKSPTSSRPPLKHQHSGDKHTQSERGHKIKSCCEKVPLSFLKKEKINPSPSYSELSSQKDLMSNDSPSHKIRPRNQSAHSAQR